MDLNEPDPHTGYPMGSYRQDPTGRYQLLQSLDEMAPVWGSPGVETVVYLIVLSLTILTGFLLF